MNTITYRSFIAFEIPESATRNCRQIKSKLSKGGVLCKWTKDNNFHITINFLGNKTLNELYKIDKEIKNTKLKLKDIIFKFSEINTFGKPPSILFIGLSDYNDKSITVVNKIIETNNLKANKCQWLPHLTLGRFRNVTESKTWFKFRSLQISSCTFPPIAITVFLSRLTQTGPIYTKLNEL